MRRSNSEDVIVKRITDNVIDHATFGWNRSKHRISIYSQSSCRDVISILSFVIML